MFQRRTGQLLSGSEGFVFSSFLLTDLKDLDAAQPPSSGSFDKAIDRGATLRLFVYQSNVHVCLNKERIRIKSVYISNGGLPCLRGPGHPARETCHLTRKNKSAYVRLPIRGSCFV